MNEPRVALDSARNTTKYPPRLQEAMSGTDLEKLRLQIISAQSVPHEKVENLLHSCAELPQTDRRTLTFYLTRCDADGFREDELVDFLLNQMVTYVLGKSEYKEIKADDARRVVLAAKETFQQTEGSGEVGELLLYVLLESRGIIQLYSKMDLKTSAGMPFHGYDAIHLEAGKSVVLHFGHAKTYASFSAGLNSALGDIERFGKNRAQKNRELRLVSKNLDTVKFGESAKYIQNMIDPYEKHKENYAEADSVFIGAEFPFTSEAEHSRGPELDKLMVEKYQQLVEDIAETVKSAVEAKAEVRHRTLLFLILPITDVESFRKRFMEELSR